MSRLPAAAAFALLAATALGLPAAAQEPEWPYHEIEGVQYYMAGGLYTGKTVLQANGQRLDFVGCSFMQLRPDLDNGLLRMHGLLDNRTGFSVTFDEWAPPATDLQGGIAQDIALDGTADGGPEHPEVHGLVAGWGTARMMLNGQRFADPVTGLNTTGARFEVTAEGYRDDATGAFLMQAVPDQEVHLRLHSLPAERAPDQLVEYRSPSELPDGSMLRGPHGTLYAFPNTRFGGAADFDIRFETNALSGMNDLSFAFYAPSGTLLANETLRPALGDAAVGSATFPLQEFGDYILRVTGNVTLSKYTVTGRLAAPESFELDLYWEEAAFGIDAYRHWAACEDELGDQGTRVFPVGRMAPPPMSESVLVSSAAALVVSVLLAVSLVAFVVAELAQRRKARR